MSPRASSGRGFEAIDGILGSYGDATLSLLDALARGDEDGTDRAVRRREECLGAYAAAAAALRRDGIPHDIALRDRMQWHQIRINDLEVEIFRRLGDLKSEVERDLGCIRQGQKTREAYTAPVAEPFRIFNGEG